MKVYLQILLSILNIIIWKTAFQVLRFVLLSKMMFLNMKVADITWTLFNDCLPLVWNVLVVTTENNFHLLNCIQF